MKWRNGIGVAAAKMAKINRNGVAASAKRVNENGASRQRKEMAAIMA